LRATSGCTPVVIKFLLDDSTQNAWLSKKFLLEAETPTRIHHPGVVRVIDRDRNADGRPFFVMEFVKGVSLRSPIRPTGLDLDVGAPQDCEVRASRQTRRPAGSSVDPLAEMIAEVLCARPAPEDRHRAVDDPESYGRSHGPTMVFGRPVPRTRYGRDARLD